MNDVDKSQVGARIKATRAARKMTQLALGQAIDDQTGQNLVSRWENGHDLPSVEKLTKMAIVLGTTTDYLLLGIRTPDEGVSELTEFTIWLRTMKPADLTDNERQALAAIRWPTDLGAPDPEWYDDALTMLRGVERKAARRRRRGAPH